jgi:hypothetical protein
MSGHADQSFRVRASSSSTVGFCNGHPRVQTSPGVLRLDHDPDRHDDRAVAVALAAHELAGKTQGGRATVSRAVGGPIARPKSGARAMRSVMLMFRDGSSARVERDSMNDGYLRRLGR